MRTLLKPTILRAAMALLLMATWGCSGSSDNGTSDTVNQPDTQTADSVSGTDSVENPGELVQSTKNRVVDPNVSAGDLDKLSEGNNSFAFKLYQQLKSEEGNLFYSPYSISIALAMTYAGAKGSTASEMKSTLAFLLDDAQLHPAFNALDQALQNRGKNAQATDGKGFRLNIANALWGARGYSFLDPFLDTLALNYGAGLRILDFNADPDAARIKINDWVAKKTEDRIKDLLPEGVIKSDTVLVLTNAIYFNAAWKFPFDKKDTKDGDFNLLDNSTLTASFMTDVQHFKYVDAEGYTAIELPYDGDELSMVILLPDAGKFAEFEGGMDATKVAQIIDALEYKRIELTLPKFEFDAKFSLNAVLKAMGMPTAFSTAADFSGMNGTGGLMITDVVHKAFVKVSEEGTEAAAATGVVVGPTSVPPPPVPVTIDRPFIFLIRDIQTKATIFVGRVVKP